MKIAGEKQINMQVVDVKMSILHFCLTRSGLEPTIYRTQGEHANHYTTNVVGLRQMFQ
jgi:hypothetical protein